MNKLDKDYQALLQDILDNGHQKGDRTGTGTISVFGRQIRHSMKDGFPLLTTKRISMRLVVTELIWFLRGDTNIKYLLDNNCHIWDGDAYKSYITKTDKWSNSGPHKLTLDELKMIGVVSGPISDYNIRQFTKGEFIDNIKTDDEFAKNYGNLGPIYGKQWRKWNKFGDWEEYDAFNNSSFKVEGFGYIDQITNLIQGLKTNPDSRRLMVSAWAVHDLPNMVLPPCHYGFQVYTRELSLKERVDIFNSKMIKEGIRTQIATVGVDESYWRKLLEETKHNIPTRAISLMFNMRSNDVPLGLPFNIASYGLLLEIIGKIVNMVPEELIATLGDAHIYTNQVDGIKEQLTRSSFKLPHLKHLKSDEFYKSLGEDLSLLSHLEISDFQIENYESHPAIKMPLSN